MATYVRSPVMHVWIDGREVTNRLSCRVSYGFDLQVAECQILVPAVPEWARKWSVVTVAMGPSATQTYHRFQGFLIEFRRSLYPRAVEMVCYGPLILAKLVQNHAQHGTDMVAAGVGATDQAQVGTALDNAGLTVAALAAAGCSRYLEGTGKTLGTVAYEEDDDGNPIGPFTCREGESWLGYIQRLDEVCLGYRTTEMAGGLIARVPVSCLPAATAALSFEEGVDIFDASTQEEILEIKNRVVVTGYAPPDDVPVYAVASQANPLVKDGTGYVTLKIQSDMIEKAAEADPGDGLACDEVAAYLLQEHNVELVRTRWSTPRGDMINPGMTLLITAPSRLGWTGRQMVQHVDCEIDEHGVFTQYLTTLGGNASSAPPDPNPLPDFSLRCEIETVIIGETETPLYTIYCEGPTHGISGEISGWAWTATGGTPANGSGRAFVTTFMDISGKTISLQVTDEYGKTGTRSKSVPPSTSPLWVYRRLYLAGTHYAECLDVGTWRVDAEAADAQVLAVGNGPVWGAGDQVMYSGDYLATSADQSEPSDGVNVTALWVETDVSATRVLVGLADGDVAISEDGGATWTLKTGPSEDPCLRVVINRELSRQWWVLTASGLYQTLDSGDTWETMLSAEEGETFRDLCISHSRWMISMSGGRLLIDAGETEQTFVPAEGQDPPTDIVAVTADIVEDRFYCIDASGKTYYHDADGSTSLEQRTDLPGGAVVKPRSLWRDGAMRGVLYIAGGTGGAWKSVDGFGSADGYFQIRAPGTGNSPADADYVQIGADGLLVATALEDTIVSDDNTVVLSLWNTDHNDDPPAGWEQPDYDDSAWSAATEQGDSAEVSGAKDIWGSSVQSGTEECLFRRTFTLAAGVPTSLVATVNGDDVIVEAYLNGIYIGSKSTDPSSAATWTLNPALLLPGTDNVLAFRVRNADS